MRVAYVCKVTTRGVAVGNAGARATSKVIEKGAGRSDVKADELSALCWCSARTIMVPKTDVRNGLTGTCGKSKCHP